jgi:tol-pal system protein YbgF
MTFKSIALPKPLLAAVTAAFLLSSASAGHAAWPWQKQPAQQSDTGSVVLAQADPDRLNRIEQQMRTLTGQIEELTHQLQVLQDQLKKMQDDNEYRFGQLEGGAAAKPAVTAPPAAGNAAAAAGNNAAAQAAPPLPAPSAAKSPAAQIVDAANAPVDKTGLGAPPKALGQLTLDAPPVIDAPPAQQQPLDLSSLAGGAADAGGGATAVPPANNLAGSAQVASLAPTGDPRADYDQAYKLVTAGRYDVAEASFRQFLAAYPSDELAPDAQYWLGESLYAHGDYAAAAEEFKAGYQKYPKSRRAPDSLLKLGLSMAGLDYRDEACKMYALALKQYPQMSNGLRSRVKAEQASASCT